MSSTKLLFYFSIEIFRSNLMKEHLNSIKVELMVEKQVAEMANQGKFIKSDPKMTQFQNDSQ